MPSKQYYDLYKTDDERRVQRKEETKKYRNENKELLALKHKEYCEKNREKIRKNWNTKMTCECGIVHSLAYKLHI